MYLSIYMKLIYQEFLPESIFTDNAAYNYYIQFSHIINQKLYYKSFILLL